MSGASLLITDDGLKTWKPFRGARDLGAEGSPFAELAFIDERRGLAIQEEGGSGRLYKTNDGGKTWTRVKLDHNVFSLARIPGTTQIKAVGEGEVYSFTPI